MSTPLERLLAETIPVRPAPAPQTPRRVPAGHHWTPQEQDAHWQALCQAVGSPHEQRPTSDSPPTERPEQCIRIGHARAQTHPKRSPTRKEQP